MAKLSDIKIFTKQILFLLENPQFKYEDVFNEEIFLKFSLLAFDVNLKTDIKNQEINKIDDIYVLGSKIYIEWMYIYEVTKLIDNDTLNWFILAFKQLNTLTQAHNPTFDGPIVKCKLLSSLNTEFELVGVNEKIEQYLMIDVAGKIKISEYHYNKDKKTISRDRKQNLEFDKYVTAGILEMLSDYFKDFCDETCEDDYWILELTSDKDTTYSYRGCLPSIFLVDNDNISSIIKHNLALDDLILFDGLYYSDQINRIDMDYVWSFKKEYPGRTKEEPPFKVRLYYAEKLTIDRASETLEHTYGILSVNKISHKYELKHSIVDLLDSFDADKLFVKESINPKDCPKQEVDVDTYRIIIKYQNRLPRIIQGNFDEDCLPDDYDEFVQKINDLIAEVGQGKMLNSYIYDSKLKKEND